MKSDFDRGVEVGRAKLFAEIAQALCEMIGRDRERQSAERHLTVGAPTHPLGCECETCVQTPAPKGSAT